jgi:uncharacterized protein YijF (DUF1287 family)
MKEEAFSYQLSAVSLRGGLRHLSVIIEQSLSGFPMVALATIGVSMKEEAVSFQLSVLSLRGWLRHLFVIMVQFFSGVVIVAKPPWGFQ